jgi:hypothetical protein
LCEGALAFELLIFYPFASPAQRRNFFRENNMAESDNILMKLQDLLLYLIPQLNKFPRNQKFAMKTSNLTNAGRAALPRRLPRRPAKRPLCPTRLALLGFIILHSAFILRVQGQNYSIDWYKVAGGGGTSTGSVYSISGTIGQPDASAAMSEGNYSVTGGFWALINVVQTPGAPTLYVSHSGNTVTVYWQNVTGWSLIQSGNLTTPLGSWAASGGVTPGVTNSLTLTNPAGNVFFRLTHP